MKKRFAFMTDLHIDEPFPIGLGVNARRNLQVVVDDVRRRGLTEIVFGGDLGENESNEWLFGQLADLDISLVLGNHDELRSIEQHYSGKSNSANELYFSIEDSGFKRIYLDSSSGRVSEQQLTWLQDNLKKESGPILLFIHHCVFPVACAIDEKHSLTNRDELQRLLTAANLPVTIFSGHYHLEDTLTIGQITQYITPAVSYQVIKAARPIATQTDSFGYRVVTLRDRQVSTELVTFSS